MRGLAGRIFVVAGAATGIGSASAMRLASEGARVIVGDINLAGAEETARQIRASGGTATAIEYDQSDEDSVARLISQTVDQFGGVDGVHANAADLRPEVWGRDVDLLNMEVGVWERTLRVDLIGYALIIRAVVPHLLSRGGGAIVCTVTTGGAPPIGRSTPVAYASAKAGVNSMARHVASRWGQEGIRCNCVAPGTVLTAAAEQLMSTELIDELRAQTRSTRLGHPDDIAAATAFLLSDDAAWINGQVLGVNGGVAF